MFGDKEACRSMLEEVLKRRTDGAPHDDGDRGGDERLVRLLRGDGRGRER